MESIKQSAFIHSISHIYKIYWVYFFYLHSKLSVDLESFYKALNTLIFKWKCNSITCSSTLNHIIQTKREKKGLKHFQKKVIKCKINIQKAYRV